MGRRASGADSLSTSRIRHKRNEWRPRSFARGYRDSHFCEALETRTLLTALPASVETATLDVLAALRDDVRSAIANHVILQTQLPVIGASIADDLDMETMLDGLYDPINTYLA